MVLAANTTAVCCPEGHDCSAIIPTTCETELMNAAKYPNSPILTTALDSDLPSCGNATCCPFGYECVSSGTSVRCVVGKNQAKYTTLASQQTKAVFATLAGSTTTPTPTHAPTSAAFTTSTILSTPTPPAAANTTTAAGSEPGAAPSHSTGIIAGSVVAALVLLAGLAAIFWKKRRKLKKRFRSGLGVGPLSHQHQRQDPPPAYDTRESEPTKDSQTKATAFCQTITSSPAHVSVIAFAELQGSAAYQHPPTETCIAQSPVELPASPLSFSLWERQAEKRHSARNPTTAFFRPPRATWVPLSRFAATQRHGHPDEQNSWI